MRLMPIKLSGSFPGTRPHALLTRDTFCRGSRVGRRSRSPAWRACANVRLYKTRGSAPSTKADLSTFVLSLVLAFAAPRATMRSGQSWPGRRRRWPGGLGPLTLNAGEVAEGEAMDEAEWLACTDPTPML